MRSKPLLTIVLVSFTMGCAYLVSCGSRSSSNAIQRSSDAAISEYERNDKKDRVIVFVHGIFGSAKDT